MKNHHSQDYMLCGAVFEGRVFHEGRKIIDCNTAACRLFHYEQTELIGLDISDLVSPEDRPKLLRNLDGRSGAAMALTGVRKGGTPVGIQALFSTVTDGRKRGGVFVCCEAPVAVPEGDVESTRTQLADLRALLVAKDTSIRELITQVEREKRQVEADVTANIDRVILPIVGLLEDKLPRGSRQQLDLIRNCLSDIAGSFVTTIEQLHAKLTPREIQVCHMIRSGFSTKDIARLLNTSVQTVFSQRKQIRRKLRLSGNDANLAAYLQGLSKGRTPSPTF